MSAVVGSGDFRSSVKHQQAENSLRGSLSLREHDPATRRTERLRGCS
jgi:hypothetical protein